MSKPASGTSDGDHKMIDFGVAIVVPAAPLSK
jgi:hypothetical protein